MEFTAEGPDAGRRADAIVARELKVSRSRAVELLASGALLLNGKKVPPDHRLKAGDVLAGEPPVQEDAKVEGESGQVPLVFSDAHLAVVNKPAGLAVHPGSGRARGTLVNILTGMGVKLAPAGGALRPGIVHRLDMDTSGLMVVAKTDEAYWRLAKMAEKHRFHREYLAITAGVPTPPTGVIAAALGRDPRRREKFTVVSSGGKDAITHYTVEESFAGAALVRVVLETGRTHQIRIHFSVMGWPLAGDTVYGTRPPRGAHPALKGMARQALHSTRFAFEHPVTGKELDFTAPLPADMEDLLKALRGDAGRKDKIVGRKKGK